MKISNRKNFSFAIAPTKEERKTTEWLDDAQEVKKHYNLHPYSQIILLKWVERLNQKPTMPTKHKNLCVAVVCMR